MNEKMDYAQYTKNMRETLSTPGMIDTEGSINHSYFRVKKGAYWSEKEQQALLRGLENFGIGNWKDIKYFELENFVP